MATRMAAADREGKKLQDVVFSIGMAAQQAAAQYGADRVVNATVGCYAGEDGKIACLPLVEKLYRALPIRDFVAYAPPLGLDSYGRAVQEEVFADRRPDLYCETVATAGGTGALHIAVANYAERGERVLVADWRWAVYDSVCEEVGRKVRTFTLLREDGTFHQEAFAQAVHELLQTQDSLVIILNTPAHNPTGFALTYDDWRAVMDVCGEEEKKGKRLSLVVDIAYIAYSGEPHEVRRFMELFKGAGEHLLIMIAFSMSKGYTLYGQRTGALVGLSSSRAVIDEFRELGKYSARTAWSNVNRAAMTLLTNIRRDKTLTAELEAERRAFFDTIMRRAAMFTKEARATGLPMIPYTAGFFISLPHAAPMQVCRRLQARRIFALPVHGGIRLGICSIPERQLPGLAAAIQATATEDR